jgi:hypothetical protein
MDNCNTITVNPLTGIARVRSLIVDWLNDVIFAVQCFIPNELDLYVAVGAFYNSEYSNVLHFAGINRNLENYKVNVAVNVISNADIINVTVSVQVEVINMVV